MAYGDKPFGLREVKLYSADGSGGVALPSSLMLHVTPRLDSARFYTDGVLIGASGSIVAAEWELEAGGLSLDATAKLLGFSPASAGSAPNRTYTLSVLAGAIFPYLRIYGRAVSDNGDGIHCRLFRCKVESLEGTFRRGDFYITSCAGVAAKHSSLGVLEWVQHETVTAL